MPWSEILEAIVVSVLGMEHWQIDLPSGLPDDLLSIADPQDPLAQSQLWGAIYSDLPNGFLVETCLLESGCRQAIGVHAGDSHLGEASWRGVWRRSKVDHSCPFYPDPDDVEPSWFAQASTRGNHGLIAAYHVFLIGDCVPLEALDIPFFSAWAAAEKARGICQNLKKKRKKCTRERLRCGWAQAKLGSSACGRVVKRFRSGLARFKRANPNFNPQKNPTLSQLRRKSHGHDQ